MATERHIVAMGGGGFWDPPHRPIDDFVLGLAGKEAPRVLFVPTAQGDDPYGTVDFYDAFRGRAEAAHLPLFHRRTSDLRSLVLEQDVVYVAGGNTANMLAIWRVHGLDAILRAAWEQGTVLCGWSAGAICWFESGVTDSFGPELAPLEGALGFLAGSFCPHYDGEAERRPTYQRLIGEGLAAGYAADDGAALHFVGTQLAEAISRDRESRAYRVERAREGVTEKPIPTRQLG